MSASTTTMFDPAKFKENTRREWDSVADAWNAQGVFRERWLGGATEAMLDMALVAKGCRVLDIAAGTGDQTLQAARRVGPGGYVLATDLSPNILARARENARQAGLLNVETRVMDAENLEVPAESFDVAISRLGLFLLPDPAKALAGIRRALKNGGRIGAIVWSSPENNKLMTIPGMIVRRRANLPLPAPGQPTPFSLAGPGVIENLLVRSGFRMVQSRKVAVPVQLESVDQFVRLLQESAGGIALMMAGFSEEEKRSTWTEIRDQMRQYETREGFSAPAEMIIASGTK